MLARVLEKQYQVPLVKRKIGKNCKYLNFCSVWHSDLRQTVYLTPAVDDGSVLNRIQVRLE